MLTKGELDFSEIEPGKGRRILWNTTSFSFIPVISRLKHSGARLISIAASFEKSQEFLFDYYFDLPDRKCIVRSIRTVPEVESVVAFFPEAAYLEKDIAFNLNVVVH